MAAHHHEYGATQFGAVLQIEIRQKLRETLGAPDDDPDHESEVDRLALLMMRASMSVLMASGLRPAVWRDD